MSSSVWRVVRGFGVRFALLFGVLLIFPFPLDALPKTQWIAEQIGKPIEWLATWFQRSVLQLGAPTRGNGSGDRVEDYCFLLLVIVLALLGALVWSALDRRRDRYPRLAAAIHTYVRYYLAMTMLSYGLAKIVKSQMPDLRPGDLDTPLGELTPMGVAWVFMGYSTAYSVFAGLAEAVGGLLLLWRRTASIGALVVIAVMTNVVMMNFCFDIPVKLFSSELLILAIVVLAPNLRRLIAAATGRAIPEVPPRPRWSPRWERARLVVKIAVLTIVPWFIYLEARVWGRRNDHVHALYGGWIVDDFAVDGVARPPLTTDPERWSKLQLNARGLWTVSMLGARHPADLTVDAEHHTLAVTPYDDPDAAPDPHEVKETWRYAQPAPDQLVLDGTRGGKQLHVTLHRAPAWPLMTRELRWIIPAPPRARDRTR